MVSCFYCLAEIKRLKLLEFLVNNSLILLTLSLVSETDSNQKSSGYEFEENTHFCPFLAIF